MNTAVASILICNMARLLDECPAGLAASAALQARFDEAKARFEKLRDKGSSTSGKRQAEEAAASFQQEAIGEIEAERARLGQGVVDSLRPVIEAVRKEHGAAVVLDTRAALAFDAAVDVTDVVLARLQAAS